MLLKFPAYKRGAMHWLMNGQRAVRFADTHFRIPCFFKGLCEVLARMSVNAYTCCLPDWVEHALETDVEPYLRTPEEELSFIVRHNIDVNACIAGASSGLLYVLWQIGRLAGNRLLNRSSKVKDA